MNDNIDLETEAPPAQLVPDDFDFDLFVKGTTVALDAIMSSNPSMTVGEGLIAAVDNAIETGQLYERKMVHFKRAAGRKIGGRKGA